MLAPAFHGPVGAAGPAAGPDEDRVAVRHLDPGALLPRFQVAHVNARAGLQIVDAFQPRDVHQHAAGEDAVAQVIDRVLLGAAFLLHLFPGEAIPHLPVEEAVREAVEMRVGVAVIVDGEPIGGAGRGRLGDHVLVGREVVFSLDRVDVGRQRHRDPVLDERGRLPALGRGDQVQRADFVVLAPAPPVRELGLPALVLRFRDRRPIARRGCATPLLRSNDGGARRHQCECTSPMPYASCNPPCVAGV